MKSILMKSALVLALGIAPAAGFARSAQTDLQVQPDQSGCQMGVNTLKPSGQQLAQTSDGASQQGGSAGQTTDSQPGVEKSNPTTEGEAQAPAKPGTEQQGAAEGSATTEETTGQTGTQSEDATKSQKVVPTDDTAKSQSQPSTETTGSVKVTTKQQTEIRQVITESKAEPVDNVDFDVNVGVEVPRTVELRPLPPRIVRIVPRYESYEYFVLADGRIVIVDPNSMEIVLIIA